MATRLRRRMADVRAGRTSGITLVEVIVVTALLLVVLGVAQEAVIMTARIVGDNAVRLDESQQAKTAMEAMSQTLRTAILPKQLSGTCTGCDVAAFISGDAKSVRFYANINNDLAIPTSGTTTFGPRRVSYVLDNGGTLTETIQAPDVHAFDNYNFTYCTPGAGCAVRTRILARNVVTTQSLFTYYSKAGTVLPVPLESSIELPAGRRQHRHPAHGQAPWPGRGNDRDHPRHAPERRLRTHPERHMNSTANSLTHRWSLGGPRLRDRPVDGHLHHHGDDAAGHHRHRVRDGREADVQARPGLERRARSGSRGRRRLRRTREQERLLRTHRRLHQHRLEGSAQPPPTRAAGQRAPPPGWINVQAGVAKGGQFHYDVDTTSFFKDGSVRLNSTGKVNGVSRTLQVRLSRGGPVDFLYSTDFEDADPANTFVYPSRRRSRTTAGARAPPWRSTGGMIMSRIAAAAGDHRSSAATCSTARCTSTTPR